MSSWFARPYRAFSSYTTTVARGADDSTCPGGASLWIRGVGAAQAIVVVAVVEPVYVLLLTPACVCLSIPGPDSRRRLGPISCGNSPLCRIQNGSLFIRSHRPRGRRLDIRRSPARATARASSFLDDRRTSRRSIRFPLSTRRHSRAGLSQSGSVRPGLVPTRPNTAGPDLPRSDNRASHQRITRSCDRVAQAFCSSPTPSPLTPWRRHRLGGERVPASHRT